MPIALIVIIVIVAIIAVVVISSYSIAQAMKAVLPAMSAATSYQNVSEIAQASHVAGWRVSLALQVLQNQGYVTSQQQPSRVRGTAAAALDLATYRITPKGRSHVGARKLFG